MYRLGTLIVACVAPLAVHAQQTLLRLSPPSGQVSTYRIEGRTAVDAAMGSMDASSLMLITATVTAADGQERTIQTVIDSFNIDAPGMPMGALPELAGTSTVVRMTTRGEVLETTYSNDVLTQRFGGMTDPQGFAAGVLLPEQPVAPGYQWSDTSVVETDAGDMGMVTVTRITHYTLERLEQRDGARIAVIAIEGSMSQSAAMVTSQGPFTGGMEIDLDAGRWLTNRMEMTMQMEAAGEPVTMTITMNGRLVS